MTFPNNNFSEARKVPPPSIKGNQAKISLAERTVPKASLSVAQVKRLNKSVVSRGKKAS